MTPEQWRSACRTFQWRGAQICERVAGAGEPLLLIHGFPTGSWDWHAIWPALATRYRVLTLDMIGLGFSAKPRDFAYTIAAQADLFEALLARHEVSRYRLIAHDFGDTVAQELLARQRERPASPRIAAMCLLNGGLFPETHRALPAQRWIASAIGPLLVRLSSFRGFAASMRRVWGRHPISNAELHAMWRLVTANDGLAVMPKLLGYIAERKRHRSRWVQSLTEAPIPIRIIAGLLDPVSGAHMLARYRQLVVHPDIVELSGVGHYPQLEAPEAVLAAVIEGFKHP